MDKIETISTGLGTMIKVMDFQYPVFKEGLNCTVRFGDKWKSVGVGEKVIFTSGESAVVQKIVCCRFWDVTNEDIKEEHDLSCRANREALYNKLCALYPGFSVHGENALVTIVYFTLI